MKNIELPFIPRTWTDAQIKGYWRRMNSKERDLAREKYEMSDRPGVREMYMLILMEEGDFSSYQHWQQHQGKVASSMRTCIFSGYLKDDDVGE